MSFTCPRCNMTSHNPNDEAEGYCGRCHVFTAHKPTSEAALAAGVDVKEWRLYGGEVPGLCRDLETGEASPGWAEVTIGRCTGPTLPSVPFRLASPGDALPPETPLPLLGVWNHQPSKAELESVRPDGWDG